MGALLYSHGSTLLFTVGGEIASSQSSSNYRNFAQEQPRCIAKGLFKECGYVLIDNLSLQLSKSLLEKEVLNYSDLVVILGPLQPQKLQRYKELQDM